MSQKNKAQMNLTRGKCMKILIVEDEKRLAQALSQIMKEAKYQTDIAYDGADGLELALYGNYDVIVLDVMLPKKDGFSVVRELRAAKSKTPVIMLTAKDEVQDKISGLDKGADDYMTKPFVPEELLARIRALSRRQGEVIVEELAFEDLSLDISNAELRCRDKNIHLSFKEFEIMKILLSNQKTIVSKEILITKVWGDDSDAEDNNVEAYISFLRKKLSFIGSKVVLTTIRKLGYKLEVNHDS